MSQSPPVNRHRLIPAIGLRIIAGLSAILFAETPASAQSFRGLGVLPGGHSTRAWAVSADGSTVTGAIDYGSPINAFRWTLGGGMHDIGGLAVGNYTDGNGVNADGSVIVGTSWSSQSGNTRAFTWNSSGMTALQPLPQAVESRANAVSHNGQIAVGYSWSGLYGNRATRWTNGVASDLGTTADVAPQMARGISADGGVIVGNAFSPSGAFRWSQTHGVQNLPLAADQEYATAAAVSANGAVTVGTTQVFNGPNPGSFAARWITDSNGITVADVLPGLSGSTWSEATAVSADGSVIVGRSTLPVTDHRAFIWRESTGMVDLNELLPSLGVDITGFKMNEAFGISADGLTIVGEATHEFSPGQFRNEAFVATVPEPGMMIFLGLGMALLQNRRKRVN